MVEGLLWFDNDSNRNLADKVRRAAKRYKSRLRQKPTVCYVNIEEFDTNLAQIDGIDVKPSKEILPHHLWIGVEPEQVVSARAA